MATFKVFPRIPYFLMRSPYLFQFKPLAWKRWTTAFACGATGGAFFGGVTVAAAYGRAVQPPCDMKALKADIEVLIEERYSNGPGFVRLAWHEAGSWDCKKKDGSPNSASMRFNPECNYPGNKGLDQVRSTLEVIKKKYPQLSYADIWSYAAVVAVEYMGGPIVPWRWGRADAKDGSVCGPDGRLPDGAKTQDHVREVFTRLGFNDEETVALIGAHTCGECHLEASGFYGPWTHDKYGFDNSFFTALLEEEWVLNPGIKKLQFMDRKTNKLMMLPSDVALLLDPSYRASVEKFAKDNDLFCSTFAKAFQKLLELGNHNLNTTPQ